MVTISIPGTVIALAAAVLLALLVGAVLKVVDWTLSRHSDVLAADDRFLHVR
jgi:hypothetical protein